MTCFLPGHAIFLNSPRMSLKKRFTLEKRDGFFAVFSLATVNTSSFPYFVSLWSVCLRQNLQYFFISSLSGSFFLFFLVVQLRCLHSVHANTILTRIAAPPDSWNFCLPQLKGRWIFAQKNKPFQRCNQYSIYKRVRQVFLLNFFIKYNIYFIYNIICYFWSFFKQNFFINIFHVLQKINKKEGLF